MGQEQQDADKALEEALRARAIAYGASPTGCVTGWYAVMVSVDYDEDGDQISKYAIATPMDQPIHIDLGLLAYAQQATKGWLDVCLTDDD